MNESEIIINNIFKSLSGIYPAWRSAFKTNEDIDNAKREWLIAFQDEGLNQQEWIDRGLREARKDTSPFLPSVGQFVDWCRFNKHRDDPVWYLHDLGSEQKRALISLRKEKGLPCGRYETLALEEMK